MKRDSIERRRHPRIDKQLALKIKGRDFDSVTETINISQSGAYCHVDKYIEPMTKLNIMILLPIKEKNRTATKKVRCQGVVVRTEESRRGGYNIAVFFNEISGPDTQKIARYVAGHLSDTTVEATPHLTFYT